LKNNSEINMNKKTLIVILIAAAAVTATSIGIGSVVFFTQPDNTLDSRIQKLMSDGNIPSLSAGIIVNDTLVWSKGYGDQPDGLDTVYMIGSVTKMFTATAIMQLYENNSLDLDTDINNYIPFSVRNPNYPSAPITPRMLLTHTSGISKIDIPHWDHDSEFIEWANNNIGWNVTALDPHPAIGEFLNGTLNPAGPYYDSGVWEDFQPGNDWQYSNLGFLLIVYIVEQIANKPYVEYLKESVIDPLNMDSTGFNYTDFTGRNALPHEQADSQLIQGPLYDFYNVGGGALRSTVPDLAKFLIAHMNQGNYNNTQILLPQTVIEMQTSQIPMFGTDLGGFSFVGYGLGWPLYSGDIIGHGGATPGYLAQISFKTVSNGKYGIVFMFNKGSSLVHDEYLLNTFFPSMVGTLFDEAARLFTL
jgi:CubicO group peptidase (beta-lactamase class C family)